jgi:hypothetical protein
MESPDSDWSHFNMHCVAVGSIRRIASSLCNDCLFKNIERTLEQRELAQATGPWTKDNRRFSQLTKKPKAIPLGQGLYLKVKKRYRDDRRSGPYLM